MLENPIVHIAFPIICAIIMNVIIYSFKWNVRTSEGKINNPLIPPGYIVGSVWIIIFGLLGYVHYLLYKQNNGVSFVSISVVCFFIFCLLYPVLTSGLSKQNANMLNLLTLILSFSLAIVLVKTLPSTFKYIIPLLLWASYVNITDAIQCSKLV